MKFSIKSKMNLATVALLCGMLSLSACSGGSDDPAPVATTTSGYSNATLTGTYSGAFFRETLPVDDQTVSGYYDMTMDGSGHGTMAATYSMSSYAADQQESGSTTYSMNSDGTFAIGDGYNYSYSTNPEGDLIITAQVSNPTEGQAVGVYAKRGSATYSVASLNGIYHYSYIGHVVGSPDSHNSAFGSIVFDGAGSFTQDGLCAELDVSSNTSCSDSGTYSINADGKVTLTNSDPSTFTGTINSKGDFIALANTSEVNEQEVMYIVKNNGTGYANTNLDGDYYIGRFSYQPTKATSCYATFSFSGGATYSASTVCSDSTGVVDSTSTFGPYNYNVNDDGTFVADDGGGQSVSGAISQDGKTIILSRINNTDKVDIMIGMKK